MSDDTAAVVHLRVAPGGRRDELLGRHGDGWKVRVTQPPDRGRANEAVRDLVASIAGVRPNAVTIVAGSSGRDKLVRVKGVDIASLTCMLDAAGGK